MLLFKRQLEKQECVSLVLDCQRVKYEPDISIPYLYLFIYLIKYRIEFKYFLDIYENNKILQIIEIKDY